MQVIGILTLAIVLVSSQAVHAASWGLLNFTISPQDAGKVVAAADKLMSSSVGKEFSGKLIFQAISANGADPATHAFVPIYKSAAEREMFVSKLQADPAWTAFQKATSGISKPVSQSLYRTMKSWGDLAETDHVWMAHAFAVSDPPAFLAALESLMASGTGKNFPGQVYLSEVVAGGISPVTHVISVGYASEAEMESWEKTRDASADWTSYLAASRDVAQHLGANLARDVKSWGPATLKAVSE